MQIWHPGVGGGVEQLGCSLAGGAAEGPDHFGDSLGGVPEGRCGVDSIVQRFPSRKALVCVLGDTYGKVHSSVVCRSRKAESSPMFTDRKADK